ncbi:MAG: peroxiredoxin [Thaumarchaeota archaeon]|nr:peroxiredoxin [Nitrososphaerota archaeon]
MKVKVGDVAPDFKLASNVSPEISLSDYAGNRSVVLYFYPKDETLGCTKEACAFRDSYEVFKEHGAEVLGVSSDSVDTHKKFAENHQLSFPLLSDPHGDLRKAYGVPSSLGFLPGRVTYVIDKKGVVRGIFNSQIHPEQHIDEALKMLE